MASMATIVLFRCNADGPLLRDGVSFVRLVDNRFDRGKEFEEFEEFDRTEYSGEAISCGRVIWGKRRKAVWPPPVFHD